MLDLDFSELIEHLESEHNLLLLESEKELIIYLIEIELIAKGVKTPS